MFLVRAVDSGRLRPRTQIHDVAVVQRREAMPPLPGNSKVMPRGSPIAAAVPLFGDSFSCSAAKDGSVTFPCRAGAAVCRRSLNQLLAFCAIVSTLPTCARHSSVRK
jgi:hypothetical protein